MSTGVTQARVIASEWVKLRTLRSTVWTLLVALLLLIGLGLIICAATNANWDRNSPAEQATFQPVTASCRTISLSPAFAAVPSFTH